MEVKTIRIYKEDFPREKPPQDYIQKVLKKEGFDLNYDIQRIDDYVNGYIEFRQKKKETIKDADKK